MKNDEELTELVRKFAEADQSGIEDGSFRPKLTFLTEDDFPRLIILPEITNEIESRDKMARAAQIAAGCIEDLQFIAIINDSWHTSTKTKSDGTPWSMGDMEYAIENQTEDAKFVNETFLYQIIDHDEMAVVSVPYDRADDSITYRWDDIQIIRGDRVNGIIPELMKMALDAPKLMKYMREQFVDPEALGLSVAAGEAHILAIGTKMILKETGLTCLVGSRDGEEDEILKKSFDSGPFSEGIRAYQREDIEEIITLEEQYDQS